MQRRGSAHRRNVRFRPALGMISAIAVGMSGCAGNGEGLDQNGRPDEGGAAPLTATFASIQQNVFTPICTQCHVGAQAPVGLRLDADSSYAMLVNTPSGEVPALRRVQPGNPEASYLVQKIEGTAAVGSRMPLNNPALPQSTIDVIKQWIANGAPRDSETGVAPKLTIQGISPLADEVLAATPGEILLQASSELDTTRLTTQNITLVRSGGDGMFDDGNESVVPVLGIDVRSTQPTVFALSLASDQTVADDYRLTISGTSAAPVMDLSGRMLNADVTEPFGQDFVMQFKVQGAR